MPMKYFRGLLGTLGTIREELVEDLYQTGREKDKGEQQEDEIILESLPTKMQAHLSKRGTTKISFSLYYDHVIMLQYMFFGSLDIAFTLIYVLLES